MTNTTDDHVPEEIMRALAFFREADLAGMTEAERRLHQSQLALLEFVLASTQEVNLRLDKLEDIIRERQSK